MPIGYYVHHHGAGHHRRALAIAARLGDQVTLLGTGLGDAPDRIDLPDDRLDASFTGTDHASRPAWLHYAPLHHRGVQRRHARIAAWIAETRPSLMVVDVSVEIACLARLCGVPVMYVRLAGQRDDPPHLGAFRDAVALLAPFPATLENFATPAWIVAKTFHAGYIGPPVTAGSNAGTDIVVVLGRGGTDFTAADIAAAAAATPQRRWLVLGDIANVPAMPPNLACLGWVPDPDACLSPHTILIGAAGDGTLALAVAAGCRFICIPQARPHAEQDATAQALHRIGAALVQSRWPAPDDWPMVLAQTEALDATVLSGLHDPMAAEKAAAFMLGWV